VALRLVAATALTVAVLTAATWTVGWLLTLERLKHIATDVGRYGLAVIVALVAIGLVGLAVAWLARPPAGRPGRRPGATRSGAGRTTLTDGTATTVTTATARRAESDTSDRRPPDPDPPLPSARESHQLSALHPPVDPPHVPTPSRPLFMAHHPAEPRRPELPMPDGFAFGGRVSPVDAAAAAGFPELAQWLALHRDGYSYSLLRFVCSCTEDFAEWLDELVLRVDLAGAPGEVPPTVYWMSPKTSHSAASVQKSVKLGVNLKLFEASRESRSTDTLQRPVVYSRGEQQSWAQWRVLRGAHLEQERQFLLCVERRTGQPCWCTVDVTLTLNRAGELGRYQAAIPADLRAFPLSD
jgi:hypothetical protein